MSYSIFKIFYLGLIFLLVFFISDAEPFGSILFRKTRVPNRFSAMSMSSTQESISEPEDFHEPEDIPENKMVRIQKSILLPFSPEKAFDAYSDLPRQPTWSSWLYSVEYLDEPGESKWTMKFFGFKYSWTAIDVIRERPHTIQWKSTSGLANFGTVTFERQNEGGTMMNLTMKLMAPRAAVKAFSKSKRLSDFIGNKMVGASLDSFRDIVMEDDILKD